MKSSKRIYIQTGLLSIALFLLGHFFSFKVFHFFEPKVDGITFQIIEHKGIIKASLLFSLVLGLIPVLTILTWKFGGIVSSNRKLASIFTILIFLIVPILIRHAAVKAYLTGLSKRLIERKTNMIYPIDPINFCYYMFIGLCFGCIVSYFLFRVKRKQILQVPSTQI
jgi:hypothetical protein